MHTCAFPPYFPSYLLKFYPHWVADMYRTMFKFGVFNAVQSECFETVSHCVQLNKLRSND